MQYLLFLFLTLTSVSSWTPLCSINSLCRLDHITIDQKNYLVRKSCDKNIIVQDHSGSLLQNTVFDNNNHRIQNNQKDDSLSPVKTYPTCRTGDILWADLSEKNNSRLMVEKENMVKIPYVKKVNCSWNFFLEYCMDVKHFGVTTTQVQLLEMNSDKLSFFIETSDKEDMKMEYISPYLLQMSDRVNNEWRCFIQILCIPVYTGETKIILCENQQKTKKQRMENHEFYSQILNVIDGIMERTGQVFVMSANYPEKLDEALLRPGRIDCKIHFKPFSVPFVKKYVQNFMGELDYSDFFQFLEQNKNQVDYKFTPSKLFELCVNSNGNLKTLESLIVHFS